MLIIKLKQKNQHRKGNKAHGKEHLLNDARFDYIFKMIDIQSRRCDGYEERNARQKHHLWLRLKQCIAVRQFPELGKLLQVIAFRAGIVAVHKTKVQRKRGTS